MRMPVKADYKRFAAFCGVYGTRPSNRRLSSFSKRNTCNNFASSVKVAYFLLHL